jgi:subtilisin family serine protease
VLSTYPGGYACLAGTSMAAPHVSGAVAVLRSLGLTPQQTVDRLLATARPAGAGTGAGALDLAAAVGDAPSAAPSSQAAPADVSPPPPADASSSSTAPGTAPSSSSSASSTASAPPVIALPNQRAGGTTSGRVTVHAPGNDDIPTGPVVVAVLMASTVGIASGWMLIRGTGWARRTPG